MDRHVDLLSKVKFQPNFTALFVFWRLKHYLRIIVCEPGVCMEMEMTDSN